MNKNNPIDIIENTLKKHYLLAGFNSLAINTLANAVVNGLWEQGLDITEDKDKDYSKILNGKNLFETADEFTAERINDDYDLNGMQCETYQVYDIQTLTDEDILYLLSYVQAQVKEDINGMFTLETVLPWQWAENIGGEFKNLKEIVRNITTIWWDNGIVIIDSNCNNNWA